MKWLFAGINVNCEIFLIWNFRRVLNAVCLLLLKPDTWIDSSGSHWTWNAPTQHQQRRWPDLKQIVEISSIQAEGKETATWNTTVWLLPPHGSPRQAPYLLHIPARGQHVCRYPPQPVSVLGPTPTLSPTFLMAQTIFEPKLFSYDTPTFSNTVHSTHNYLPMKMEQTVCSETSA